MEREKKGRKYEKPKVIYRKRMETLAVVCDSARGGSKKVCRTSACEKPRL